MVDREIVTEVFCRNFNYLHKVARNKGIDSEDRDDFLDEVYEEVLKSLRKGNGPEGESVLSWIVGIANNIAKKYRGRMRKYKAMFRKAEKELSDMDYIINIADEVTVESIILEAERHDILQAVLDILPETTRRIVVMHTWGRNTFDEIADILDLNINTVKSAYYRSRKILKDKYVEITGEEGVYD